MHVWVAGISTPLAATAEGPQNWILKLHKHHTFTYIKWLWSHTKEIKAFLILLLESLNCQSWEDHEYCQGSADINECLKIMILLIFGRGICFSVTVVYVT